MKQTFEQFLYFIQRHLHEFLGKRKDLSHADTQNDILSIRGQVLVRVSHLGRAKCIQAF